METPHTHTHTLPCPSNFRASSLSVGPSGSGPWSEIYPGGPPPAHTFSGSKTEEWQEFEMPSRAQRFMGTCPS